MVHSLASLDQGPFTLTNNWESTEWWFQPAVSKAGSTLLSFGAAVLCLLNVFSVMQSRLLLRALKVMSAPSGHRG